MKGNLGRWLRESSSVEDQEHDEGLGSQGSRLRFRELREGGQLIPRGSRGVKETFHLGSM